MRFIQFSDVHIDGLAGRGTLCFGSDKKAVLKDDVRQSFIRAVEHAKVYNADILLVPGDLFDYETSDKQTVKIIIDAFASIAPIRVFITPGNHDSLKPQNPYMDDIWPSNVRIFRNSDFESVILDDLGCSITGIGHSHRGILTRLKEKAPKPAGMPIDILLFHGSRESFMPAQKENVLPFNDMELLDLGFTYSAIGHYHSMSVITDTSGNPKSAYSGCVQGVGLDESGIKTIILGEIDSSGKVKLDTLETASRRILNVEIKTSGANSVEAIKNRLASALIDSAARDCDILNMKFSGVFSASIDINSLVSDLIDRYFYVNVDISQIEPDYDMDSILQNSNAAGLKSAFTAKMQEMAGQCDDEEEKLIIGDAFYYGLSALDGRKLEPRYED